MVYAMDALSANDRQFIETARTCSLEELARLCDDYELDFETEHMLAVFLMTAIGERQSIPMMNVILRRFSGAWACVVHPILGVARRPAGVPIDWDFIATILWSHKDNLHISINSGKDIFIKDLVDVLEMMPDDIKDFIKTYVFDDVQRPTGERIMTLGVDDVLDEDVPQNEREIIKYCIDKDFEKIRSVLAEPGRCSSHDIFNILWWCGFEADLDMLNLVINTAKDTPNEEIVRRKINMAVPTGMSESLLFSPEVIDRSLAYVKSADPELIYLKPFELFIEEFLDELRVAPNRKVYRYLQELSGMDLAEDECGDLLK
jgi:hypothetical protein